MSFIEFVAPPAGAQRDARSESLPPLILPPNHKSNVVFVALLRKPHIEEYVAHIDILACQVSEDAQVAGTVRKGQFYLHAVVIGIGEDAVL